MPQTTPAASTYAVYWLYRVDPAFHRLPESEQQRAKREFLDQLEARADSVRLRGVYSFAGLRSDADFMLWVLGEDLEAIQRLAVALRRSGLGRYLEQAQTYLGVTSAARYDPEHLPAFMQGVTPKQYLSMYPFIKTAEWYLLPYERRRELMGEHGAIGRRYAVPRDQLVAQRGAADKSNGKSNGQKGGAATAVKPLAETVVTETVGPEEGGGVLASTVDAFGLGDYEFILANESDDPAELCRMMLSLRATDVRRYTKLDTPIYLGRLRTPSEALAEL